MGSGLFRCEARLTTEKDPFKNSNKESTKPVLARGRVARLRHDAVMLT